MTRRYGLAAPCVVALAGSLAAQSLSAEEQARAPDPFYCSERGLGSWFYCDPPKSDRAKPEPERVPQTSAPEPATARMAAITAELDELKAQAILEPTPVNVSAYIRFQREQLDRASLFADVWSRALWQNPDLDYTLQRPVNTLGKQVWSAERRLEREAAMEALTSRYGVFYFYSSSCPACARFNPVMRALSDRFGLEVLAVSLDGGANAVFPNYVVDQGQYERMGLGPSRQVPALVLFDTQTKQPIPIGYGIMAADEVMSRIFTLTKLDVGSDY
ncbi:MAG: conjugal transfer protein TraF [Pseudomonadota bacterium]